REQRSWVKMNSAGKMVLNLFAYTCGFSVAAALGGANSVHSVDLSKSYLAWGRENFKLNHVPQESHKFYARDCMEFLKHAERNNLHYDLIICDPPSFGRSGKRVFQIAKDLPELLRRVVSRLTPGGELLFSTNYEGWSSSQLQKILEGLALPISIDAR